MLEVNGKHHPLPPALRDDAEDQLAAIDALPGALLRRAFSGEL